MEKKTKRFLWCSAVIELIVCISVFVWLTVFMSRKTENTIVEVGEIYLSEMSRQIQQKFTSVVGLRLEQVEGVIRRTPPEAGEHDSVVEGLQTSAGIRGFVSLGFCAKDGTIENVYGKKMWFINPDDLEGRIANGDDIVEQGFSEDGEKLLILGKKAEYPMKDGEKSVALVAALSMDYLNGALYLEEDGAMVYSHIIDDDGSYVIRNADAYRHSYFDRIREEFGESDQKDAESYVRELQNAINAREDYSVLVQVNGDQRHVYCSPLSENSKWYLITVMPDGVLDKSITSLDTLRIWVILACLSMILLTMLIIFILYYRLSQQQVKELDSAKREAERANKAKSEFLSSMSHDIRTPMNAILGMTEIALKNVHDAERVEDCLKKVKLSGKHLLGLINDVLDMSKIESGKMSLNVAPLSLRETMDDIVNIMQPQVKQKKQRFDVFVRDIIAENVYCDSVRLNQVLLNILSNAVKFTPENGAVDVLVWQEKSPAGEEFVRTHFRVKDTGIGMSREFQEKIFDSFARENTQQVQNITGTGLGMPIAKYIVDIMGGSIEIESELQKGSEFHVTLDLKVVEGTETAKQQQENKKVDFEGRHILLAEDIDMNWEIANEILTSLGIVAERAVNGQACVDKFKQSEAGYYSAVLMDIRMPVMNGYDASRVIRSLDRPDHNLPIIAMTADAFSDDIQNCLRSGMNAHIAKPIDIKELVRVLQKYLGV